MISQNQIKFLCSLEKKKFRTLENQIITKIVDGLLAICIQHEIDHLNGKLFIDYLSPLKRNRLKKKIRKQRTEEHRSESSKRLFEKDKSLNKIL